MHQTRLRIEENQERLREVEEPTEEDREGERLHATRQRETQVGDQELEVVFGGGESGEDEGGRLQR